MRLAFVAPLREALLLSEAERRARAYAPSQAAQVRALTTAAQDRQRAAAAASDAGQGVAAISLLVEAVRLLVRAGDVASPDRGAPPAEWQDARIALEATDPLYLDRLDRAALIRMHRSLETTAAWLRAGVEPRSRTHLRGLRVGRLLALALVLLYAIGTWVVPRVVATNVARGKPVTASSRHPGTPDGHDLVDGSATEAYAVHTSTEDDPWVMIDLERTFLVQRIAVHNRGDAWQDDCLPLTIELSEDGVHFDEIARRRDHFDQNPPWVVDARKTRARFVKLHSPHHGYVALSKVEVYALR